jgi:hypothetical protein
MFDQPHTSGLSLSSSVENTSDHFKDLEKFRGGVKLFDFHL